METSIGHYVAYDTLPAESAACILGNEASSGGNWCKVWAARVWYANCDVGSVAVDISPKYSPLCPDVASSLVATEDSYVGWYSE